MAPKRRLNQYTGPLSAEQIAEGMNAAAENARRLCDDSERLLKAGSYPTAASLAILAIEEVGKVSVLREFAVLKTDAERVACWKRYRRHTAKNFLVFLMGQVASEARTLDGFKPLFAPDSDLPALADNLKQLGLYTDCFGSKHWSNPSEVIDQKLARNMVIAANVATHRASPVTVREVALWQRFVGPVWGRSLDDMKAALVKWHEAMVAEGMKPKDEAGAMASFAWGLLKPSARQ